MRSVCVNTKDTRKMASGIQVLPGALFLVCLASVPCMGTTNSCVELGFSSNLLCSSCRDLREFKLEELETDCEQCCTADVEGGDEKVRLLYCIGRTNGYLVINSCVVLTKADHVVMQMFW